MKVLVILFSNLMFMFAISQVEGVEHGKNIVCYFTNWSQYRTGESKFLPKDLDPFLCTHVVYSFLTIKDNQLVFSDKNDPSRVGELMAKKAVNPDLLITAAVGGWNVGGWPFMKVCENEATMEAFANTSVAFLRKHGFDGLDIDWEYPSTDYIKKFPQLCNIIKSRFKKDAEENGVPSLILTAAVAAGYSTIATSYEIQPFCEAVDLIHLMSYDLHGVWEQKANHHSPLHYGAVNYGPWKELYKKLNVNSAVKIWLKGGCPKEKLVMGIPFYGKTYTLTDPSRHKYGAPVDKQGVAGPYTKEMGALAYYEICTMINGTETQPVRNKHAVSPYIVKGDQWIGYDDEESVREKVRYLRDERDLAGAMIWTIDFDNFSMMCPGQRRFVLTKAIREELYCPTDPLLCRQEPTTSTTTGESNPN